MRISDWSSDVCSSDLPVDLLADLQTILRKPGRERIGIASEREQAWIDDRQPGNGGALLLQGCGLTDDPRRITEAQTIDVCTRLAVIDQRGRIDRQAAGAVEQQLWNQRARILPARTEENHVDVGTALRSEEHTSELQSLMRSSYAVFCL